MQIYRHSLSPVEELTRFHKALADETRLRILYLLRRHGEQCVCDLQAILQTPQSTASRHLHHLKQAGLVEDRRDGMWVHYSLPAEPHEALRVALETLAVAMDADPVAQEDLARAAARARDACAPGQPSTIGAA